MARYSAAKRRNIIAGALCTMAVGAMSIVSCVAWFYVETKNDTTLNVKGGAHASYFNGGNGTAAIEGQEYKAGDETGPYQIYYPTQLYYLSWLQYLGYFNEREGTHFVLTNDLDMKDYVLPPIGTIDEPFIGVFDGNGHTISNLKVSSDYGSLTSVPHEALNDGETGLKSDINIVGMFGVVGNYDGDAVYSSSEDQIYDFVLDNPIITSSSSKALGGLLVGYMNGPVKEVGVYKGALSFANAATPISNGALTGNLSDASIIGYASAQFRSAPNVYTLSDVTIKEHSGEGGSQGGGEGDEQGWGGSIDVKTLLERMNFMSQSTNSNMKKGVYRNSTFNWTANGSYIALREDRAIPLSIDNEMNQTFYNNNDNEIVSNGNSGYIVGLGGTSSSNFTARVGGNTDTSLGISSSLNGQSTYKPYTESDKTSNLALVTINSSQGSNAIVQIRDDYNSSISKMADANSISNVDDLNLTRYNAVRSSLNELLDNPGYNYYLRWAAAMSTTSVGCSNENDLSNYTKVTIPGKINGINYQNYETLRYMVNVSVKENGYITAVGRPYGSAKASMAGLVRIKRDDSGAITFRKVVQKTEVDDKMNVKTTYIDGTTDVDTGFNESTKRTGYDKALWTGFNARGYLMYVEIPVQKGDYAFGRTDTNSNNNGFSFCYLDLGVNGGEEEEVEGTYKEWSLDQVFPKTWSISGLDFITTLDKDRKDLYLCCVVSIDDPASYTFNRNGAKSMQITGNVQATYAENGMTITDSSGPVDVDYSSVDTTTIVWKYRITTFSDGNITRVFTRNGQENDTNGSLLDADYMSANHQDIYLALLAG